jgi:hypothetical protein
LNDFCFVIATKFLHFVAPSSYKGALTKKLQGSLRMIYPSFELILIATEN